MSDKETQPEESEASEELLEDVFREGEIRDHLINKKRSIKKTPDYLNYRTFQRRGKQFAQKKIDRSVLFDLLFAKDGIHIDCEDHTESCAAYILDETGVSSPIEATLNRIKDEPDELALIGICEDGSLIFESDYGKKTAISLYSASIIASNLFNKDDNISVISTRFNKDGEEKCEPILFTTESNQKILVAPINDYDADDDKKEMPKEPFLVDPDEITLFFKKWLNRPEMYERFIGVYTPKEKKRRSSKQIEEDGTKYLGEVINAVDHATQDPIDPDNPLCLEAVEFVDAVQEDIKDVIRYGEKPSSGLTEDHTTFTPPENPSVVMKSKVDMVTLGEPLCRVCGLPTKLCMCEEIAREKNERKEKIEIETTASNIIYISLKRHGATVFEGVIKKDDTTEKINAEIMDIIAMVKDLFDDYVPDDIVRALQSRFEFVDVEHMRFDV